MSFSCSFPFFIFVVTIATSTDCCFIAGIHTHSDHIDFSSPEKDRSIGTRAISYHDIGSSGTSTGLTNSIRKHENTIDQADILVESSFPKHLSSTKTTNGKKEGRDIMEHEQQSRSSLAESQFYARTSNTPITQRHDLIYTKSDEIYSSPPMDDIFHDAIDDLSTNQDQTIDDKSKQNLHFLFIRIEMHKSKNNVPSCRPLSHEFIQKSIN